MAKRQRAETVVSNGLIMSKDDLEKHTFGVNTKFLLSNHTYHMEDFRVTECSEDCGTDFRRIASGMNDAIVTLVYLQGEYVKGNLNFLDDKKQPIPNPNKKST